MTDNQRLVQSAIGASGVFGVNSPHLVSNGSRQYESSFEVDLQQLQPSSAGHVVLAATYGIINKDYENDGMRTADPSSTNVARSANTALRRVPDDQLPRPTLIRHSKCKGGGTAKVTQS